MDARKLAQVSVADYLKLEQETDTKYEYHNGEVFAMAGGTIAHGLISGNTFGELKFALRQQRKDCIAINNDVKLHIASANKFLYPDVMVVCGEMEPAEHMTGAILNPTVIIEVLSESTASYDRGDKFFFYRQVESLQEYVLIEQDKAQVDIYQRKAGLWKITRIEGLDATLLLSALGVEIPLANIYERVLPR